VQIVLANGDLHPIKTDALFKSHIFQMFPWWLFERSRGQQNRRAESCEKPLGLKVYLKRSPTFGDVTGSFLDNGFHCNALASITKRRCTCSNISRQRRLEIKAVKNASFTKETLRLLHVSGHSRMCKVVQFGDIAILGSAITFAFQAADLPGTEEQIARDYR
jgi:hypothetical protein